MIIQGTNKQPFHLKFVSESSDKDYDFCVILGIDENDEGAVGIHMTREEIAQINGLVAYIDRKREDEINGAY